MSGLSMFNANTATLNDLWYESHASLIKMLCMEFGESEKIAEMLEKYLGQKLKIKAPKDPNKPKRAKSGFMFYCDEHRPALMAKAKKKGKIVIGDISKALGKSWKSLKNKSKYDNLALADKERYEKAIGEYNDKLGL
tara:strand:- start:890 stop:1300 length:411 start_codon:yes stop_codon:yes gene_type:complete